MNPDYQIITLADGVTKAIRLPGPVIGISDLQAQLVPLQSQLDIADGDLATAQQKITDVKAQMKPIQDQIDALQNPATVATPTTITTTDPTPAL